MSRDAIRRDPAGAAACDYDLIVVGGGIQGIMLALEAVRRRLRPLLLERQDFAGATSHNSLRILHGGLRYLQSLDLRRSLDSLRERDWWLRHFPELVAPLPCLMPLYGDGLRRPTVLRLALALIGALDRWQGDGGRRLAAGGVLAASDVAELFSQVDARGLQGGAVWYDAFAPEAPRLCIEALRWACAEGAVALNYVEAQDVIRGPARVAGIRARDLETGERLEFRADVVINAAGPWAGRFVAGSGTDEPRLFDPVLAWNVAFARPSVSEYAVAVRPRPAADRAYFLVPWQGVLLAGTGYARAHGDDPRLPGPHLRAFIADLNAAVPGLALQEGDVVRIFTGFLPAAEPGGTAPAERTAIVDHGARGGTPGFFSLRAVKLTTARALADRVLRRAFPEREPAPEEEFRRPTNGRQPQGYSLSWSPGPDDRRWLGPLRDATEEEAALHLDDLLLRRSSIGDDPTRAFALAPAACRLFPWAPARAHDELERLRARLEPLLPEAAWSRLELADIAPERIAG